MISDALYILGGFLIFMLAVLGILYRLRIRFFGKTVDRADLLPYEKTPSLLSAAERSFYGVLCQAVDHRYSIFAKVRLSDIVEVAWGTRRAMGYRNRINQKHVDFVLCESTTFTCTFVSASSVC